jgi:hypothetical protein
VKRDGKSLLEWIWIHFLRSLPDLAGPELGFSRTSTASVLRNDACLRLPARNNYPPIYGCFEMIQKQFKSWKIFVKSPVVCELIKLSLYSRSMAMANCFKMCYREFTICHSDGVSLKDRISGRCDATDSQSFHCFSASINSLLRARFKRRALSAMA